LGRPTKENLDEYAAALRFVLDDSDALVQALLREHCYLGLQKRKQPRPRKSGGKRGP
jgi:hypothetical protein